VTDSNFLLLLWMECIFQTLQKERNRLIGIAQQKCPLSTSTDHTTMLNSINLLSVYNFSIYQFRKNHNHKSEQIFMKIKILRSNILQLQYLQFTMPCDELQFQSF
jgi:hypothetical protein